MRLSLLAFLAYETTVAVTVTAPLLGHPDTLTPRRLVGKMVILSAHLFINRHSPFKLNHFESPGISIFKG